MPVRLADLRARGNLQRRLASRDLILLQYRNSRTRGHRGATAAASPSEEPATTCHRSQRACSVAFETFELDLSDVDVPGSMVGHDDRHLRLLAGTTAVVAKRFNFEAGPAAPPAGIAILLPYRKSISTAPCRRSQAPQLARSMRKAKRPSSSDFNVPRRSATRTSSARPERRWTPRSVPE